MTPPDPLAPVGAPADAPLWEDLVAAALLGTDRRPFEGRPVPGPLADVVAGPSLADAAAAAWAYMEAGRRLPVGSGSARPPAPADDRPLLSRGAVRALSAILDDPRLRILLDEWLELAGRDGRRLPGRWLPDLLDAVDRSTMPAVELVAGPLALWLVAQNRSWQPPDAVPAGLATRLVEALRASADGVPTGLVPMWSGSDPVRTALFARVRASDPEAARWLAGLVWADEPGPTRAAIVASLAEGLSMADEPFLERCLDDRRRDVREAAAALLRQLPGSRLARRMAARTRPLVTLDGSPPVLTVAPPPEPDRDARRDGVGPAGTTDSDGAARLTGMVGSTPLATWEAGDGLLPPPALVAAAVASSGGGGVSGGGARGSEAGGRGDRGGAARAAALLAGWTLAAIHQADRKWAARLLTAGADPEPGLLGLVDAATADRAVTGWLARTPLPDAVGLLVRIPRPWSEAVTTAVMDAVAALVATAGNPTAPPGRRPGPAAGPRPGAPASPRSGAAAAGAAAGTDAVRDALIRVATVLDPTRPDLAARPLAALEAVPEGARPGARLYWGRHLDRLVVLANFRHYMRQEFR